MWHLPSMASSLSIEDSIVEPLGAPEWKRVVEFEDVDSTTGILVATTVDFCVTVSTINWNQLVSWKRVGVFATPGGHCSSAFHISFIYSFQKYKISNLSEKIYTFKPFRVQKQQQTTTILYFLLPVVIGLLCRVTASMTMRSETRINYSYLMRTVRKSGKVIDLAHRTGIDSWPPACQTRVLQLSCR